MKNEKKVAQMAAYFLHLRGGTMSYIKLMKLLYAADRESMDLHGYPISFDNLSSMPFGPVLSGAVDLTYGKAKSDGSWSSWVTPPEKGFEVSLKQQIRSTTELGALSRADLEVLDRVYEKFGAMFRFDVVEYMHETFPEYQDPRGSSIPIEFHEVFLQLGYDEEDAMAMQQDIEATRRAEL